MFIEIFPNILEDMENTRKLDQIKKKKIEAIIFSDIYTKRWLDLAKIPPIYWSVFSFVFLQSNKSMAEEKRKK